MDESRHTALDGLSDSHVVACPDAHPDAPTLTCTIESLIDKMPWVSKALSRSTRILVKPNLGGGHPESMTSKDIMVAFCAWLRRNFDATVTLGDSSVVGSHSELSVETLGLREALEPLGVEVMDLADCPTVRVPIPNGQTLADVHIYEPVINSDFLVSLAKLKTNFATRTTLTIKNLKGIISGPDKIRFHRLGVAECLADLLTVFMPQLGIIDGIQGWDINRSVDVGALVGGTNAVAVDYLGALLSQTDPGRVAYLMLALERGLGVLPSTGEQEKARRLSKPFVGPLDNAAGITLPEGMEIIAEGACSGCISILQTVLQRMEAAGTLEGLPPLTVALGPRAHPPTQPGRTIIAMGNCSGARKDATCVMVGCPPQSRFEVQRVFDELRSKLPVQ